MRCFIGLDLTASEKLALDSWRQKALPEISLRHAENHTNEQASGYKGKRKSKNNITGTSKPYAITPANYHLTLCFLGNITHRQHDSLISQLDKVEHSPFSFTLDTSGIWNGPKILFVAPSSVPSELMSLAKTTRKVARASAIEVENKPYRPHVTLVRKATPALPVPLYSPCVEIHATAFHLFESVSSPQGVRYPIRYSWKLKRSMSVREMLRTGFKND